MSTLWNIYTAYVLIHNLFFVPCAFVVVQLLLYTRLLVLDLPVGLCTNLSRYSTCWSCISWERRKDWTMSQPASDGLLQLVRRCNSFNIKGRQILRGRLLYSIDCYKGERLKVTLKWRGGNLFSPVRSHGILFDYSWSISILVIALINMLYYFVPLKVVYIMKWPCGLLCLSMIVSYCLQLKITLI